MADVPVVHHWLAGEDMNAERMNEIKAQIDFLRNPPMVHVARFTTIQTLTGGTWNAISFDLVINSYDPYDMFDSGQPTKVFSQVPGWYTVEGQFSLNQTNTDGRLILGIYKNGFTDDELQIRSDIQNFPSSCTGCTNLSKEGLLFLNVGDYVHLGIWFDQDATRDTKNATLSETCRLRLRWVSN